MLASHAPWSVSAILDWVAQRGLVLSRSGVLQWCRRTGLYDPEHALPTGEPGASVFALYSRDVPLAPLTWLRVGGPAEAVFHPADADDLAVFLRALPAGVPVLPIGVASNLLVRDGGVSGVVIRLGGPLARIAVDDDTVVAGAGALDQRADRSFIRHWSPPRRSWLRGSVGRWAGRTRLAVWPERRQGATPWT